MSVYYTVTYNGYVFEHAKLTWQEQSVYASDNMTLEGTEYNFTVSGTIVENSQEDFYNTLNEIKASLRVPRQTFTAVWNSDEEGNGPQAPIQISSAEDSISTGYPSDTAWGPLPSNLQINEFIAGRAAMYSWTLKARTKECYSCSTCNPTSGITPILSLSVRWSHSIDASGLTTRNVSGILVLDSKQVDVYQTAADSYRNWVQPSLPKGFKPDKQDYAQSEDGRILSFSCTQIEKFWTLPQPMADGQMSMSASYDLYGGIAHYNFSGYFTVTKQYSKALILQTVAGVISQKMSAFNGVCAVITEQQNYIEDIFGNRVSFNVTFALFGLVIAGTSLQTSINNLTGPFGLPVPTYSTGTSQNIGPYGGDGSGTGSGVVAGVPSPLDSCTQIPTPGSESFSPVPANTTSSNLGSQQGQTGSPYQPPNDGSQTGATFPYLEYHEEVSFHVNNGFVLFYPKSNSGPGVYTQQTRQPTLIITQAGYSSQAASNSSGGPVAPPPWYNTDGNSVVLSSDSGFEAPVPIGNGQYNKYTINWRYVIEVDGPFESTSDLGFAYPKDPRRQSSGTLGNPFNGTDVGENAILPNDTINPIVDFPD